MSIQDRRDTEVCTRTGVGPASIRPCGCQGQAAFVDRPAGACDGEGGRGVGARAYDARRAEVRIDRGIDLTVRGDRRLG